MPLTVISPQSVNRICCLIIGKYGMGKTSLLRTILGQQYIDGAWQQVVEIPDGQKVCVLSAESGLLAVRDLIVAGLVEGYEIANIMEFKEAYQMLATNQAMKDRYRWVFIDSLTEISARCDEAMREKYPDKSKTFARWDDYYASVGGLVKGFRDLLAYSVAFTALETIEKDDSNRRFPAPDVIGRGLKEKLPSYFDEVFYMQVESDAEGDHRVLYTQPVREFPAKDRSGKLDIIEPANLLHIHNKILEIEKGEITHAAA
jgi:GTPase SAR1 family protein